jgi:hypothetical protein
MIWNKNVAHKMGIVVFVCILGILPSACSKEQALPKNASLLFEKTKHDFGEIPRKKEASVTFNFENTSEYPLVISDVKTTCGCAAPKWPKEVVLPSEKKAITVTYDAEYPGRFNKTITVFYNGQDSPTQLTIKGQVPYPNN